MKEQDQDAADANRNQFIAASDAFTTAVARGAIAVAPSVRVVTSRRQQTASHLIERHLGTSQFFHPCAFIGYGAPSGVEE